MVHVTCLETGEITGAVVCLSGVTRATATRWHQWWEYEGLSGPQFWGLMNPEWALCKEGRQQSPIDIEPSRLLFDPNLKHLHVESTQGS
ncbi:hypothetical protein ACOMHN_016814 [Nucella lapillus]